MTGTRIRMLRKESGMTQVELGKLLGVGQPAIISYEKDISDPPHDRLIRLSNIFGVSLEYLLGISDDRENRPERSTNVIKEINLLIDDLQNAGKMTVDGVPLGAKTRELLINNLEQCIEIAHKFSKL